MRGRDSTDCSECDSSLAVGLRGGVGGWLGNGLIASSEGESRSESGSRGGEESCSVKKSLWRDEQQ